MANYIDILTPEDREAGNKVSFVFRRAHGNGEIAVWSRERGAPEWRSPQGFVRIRVVPPPKRPPYQTYADLSYFAEDYVAGPPEVLIQTYADPSYFAEVYVSGPPEALTQTYADPSYFAEAYVAGPPQGLTQDFADSSYFAGDYVA